MQTVILASDEQIQQGFDLRHEVFVIEQKVPLELEIDELDKVPSTLHVGLYEDETLIAVGRITDYGTAHVHMGRIAVKSSKRGNGIGKQILLDMEAYAKQAYSGDVISELSAQIQAENFYNKLGYTRVNDNIYLDAGIEHVDMQKLLK